MALYGDLALPAQGYIRLATIAPGNFKDDITVHISIADFDKDKAPEYEALSYAWGSEDDPELIQIKTEGNNITCPVTRNLATALRHLRKADAPRVMWIDAICIDQSDRAEKSHQVERMGEIYQLAKRVVAFLGPEENDSSHGMDMMRYIRSQAEVDWSCNDLNPAKGAKDTRFGDARSVLPLASRNVSAIYHILCRSWFERLWIRQEIFLASAEAVIQCGNTETTWLLFRRALACLSIKLIPAHRHSQACRQRLLYLFGLIWQANLVSLWDIHEVFGNATCSDPRDRVFAVRALLKPGEKDLCPVPDYTRSFMDIYEDVVLNFLGKFTTLGILRECNFDPHASSPSWVPNWSKRRTTASLRPCPLMASSQFAGHYDIPKPSVLRVAGVACTTICELQAIPDLSDATGDRLYEVCCQILTTRVDNQISLSDDELEAYARTLVCGCIADGVDRNRAHPSLEAAKSVIALASSAAAYDNAAFAAGSDKAKFLDASVIMGGYQFARCADNSIGIVPMAARPGDQVCVLMGCHSPMLLRPTASGESLLIGEGYVNGLCQGEALLGPLPKNVRLVKAIQNAEVGYALGFADSTSGSVFFEDPRLKKLSKVNLSGFREQLKANGNSVLSVDPNELRDLGVNIRYFSLT
ncbi:HET-domain-containing protein [Hypoxylon sp. FL1284]|nr:HET-domain-containing protein [Hypoxylon sp. FL1284]